MRYWEIASSVRVPVSCEEQELIDKAKDSPIAKDALDEREQELARLMLSRGVLDHFQQDDRVFYELSSPKNIWRHTYG